MKPQIVVYNRPPIPEPTEIGVLEMRALFATDPTGVWL